jgi:serine/threonine protein kinase
VEDPASRSNSYVVRTYRSTSLFPYCCISESQMRSSRAARSSVRREQTRPAPSNCLISFIAANLSQTSPCTSTRCFSRGYAPPAGCQAIVFETKSAMIMLSNQQQQQQQQQHEESSYSYLMSKFSGGESLGSLLPASWTSTTTDNTFSGPVPTVQGMVDSINYGITRVLQVPAAMSWSLNRDELESTFSGQDEEVLTAEDMVEGITRDSPFLRDTQPCCHVPHFHRDELHTGSYLRQGHFSESFAITGFGLNNRRSEAPDRAELSRNQLAATALKKGRLTYAIKQVNSRLKTYEEAQIAIATLLLEANYMSRFNHRSILKVWGLVFPLNTTQHYEICGVITDRISQTLDQRIAWWNQQTALKVEDDIIIKLKTDYAWQVADALQYLHTRRIVFRDLTPQNIGFKDDDSVQLMNFDCARELPQGRAFLEDGFVGNHTYMAIEMFETGRYDFEVDVFAWGIILFEMLTQKPAFQSLPTHDERQGLIRGQGWCPQLSVYDFIPFHVQDLLLSTWSHDARERINIHEVVKRLEWILFGLDDTEEESHAGDASEVDILSFRGEKEEWIGLDLDTIEDDDTSNGIFCGTASSFIPLDLLLEPSEEYRLSLGRTCAINHRLPRIENSRPFQVDPSKPYFTSNIPTTPQHQASCQIRIPEMARSA